EVGGERRDPLGEVARSPAEAEDLPAVADQPAGEVPAADSRYADDERAAAQRTIVRSPGPRRPRTTQIARTVSVPSLLSRCGVEDGKVIESPGSRTNSSKPTTTRSVPLRTKPNSWPLWRTNAPSGLEAPPGS